MFPDPCTIKAFSYRFANTMLSYPADYEHLETGTLLIFRIKSTEHSCDIQ